MTDNLQSVVLDGISIQTTTQGAQAIGKLQTLLSQAADGHQTVVAQKDAEIAALNTKLATADAALEAANGKVLNDAALDARVEARSQLLSDAKAIAPDVVTKGLSDADIRKAVVTKALGDAAVAGKPQAYLDARFDILLEDATKSAALDGALGSSITSHMPATDAAAHDAAMAASVNNINDWRNKKAG